MTWKCGSYTKSFSYDIYGLKWFLFYLKWCMFLNIVVLSYEWPETVTKWHEKVIVLPSHFLKILMIWNCVHLTLNGVCSLPLQPYIMNDLKWWPNDMKRRLFYNATFLLHTRPEMVFIWLEMRDAPLQRSLELSMGQMAWEGGCFV